jgi:hypothetical protein
MSQKLLHLHNIYIYMNTNPFYLQIVSMVSFSLCLVFLSRTLQVYSCSLAFLPPLKIETKLKKNNTEFKQNVALNKHSNQIQNAYGYMNYSEKDGYDIIEVAKTSVVVRPSIQQEIIEILRTEIGPDFNSIESKVQDFLEHKSGKPEKGYIGKNSLILSTKEKSLKTEKELANIEYCYRGTNYKIDNWYVFEYTRPADCVENPGDGASCPRLENQTARQTKYTGINISPVKYAGLFLFVVALGTIAAVVYFKRKTKS